MHDAIIIGAGGQAKVIIDLIQETGEYVIKGCVDIYGQGGGTLQGYPIIGNSVGMVQLGQVASAFIAIGDNYKRGQWVSQLKARYSHLTYPIAIHPKSICAVDAQIGEGTVVGAGAVIQTATQIGCFCIVNTQGLLEHDGKMGNYSSLAPKSCTGGGVSIGDYTAIGLHATLLQGISIGEHSVVGAGAVVTKDLRSHIVAYGVPAREIREREVGERYL